MSLKKETKIIAEKSKNETKEDQLDLYEVPGSLFFRPASPEERNRFQERVPEQQKEALKICTQIFNTKCQYPWYVIGSIAFLINAKESKKQPDDIDIIFHEKDFPIIKEEFAKLGFQDGIAPNTQCPFIKGKIKLESGEEVEVEAFGQKTDVSNGIINPGAADTSYAIIRNYPSDYSLERFNTLDRDGQIELYFKNLSEEIKDFNLESFLKNYEEHGEEYYSKSKAGKFINRLANLFELNDNNAREIFFTAGRISANDPEKRKLLREFLDISSKFSANMRLGELSDFNDDSQAGQRIKKKVIEVLDTPDIQNSVEKLKETISLETKSLLYTYQKINKELEKAKNDPRLKNDLYQEIEKVIDKKERISKALLQDYQDIDISHNNYKNLAPYIFTIKFIQNYLHPFVYKMEEIKKKLKKEMELAA